MGWETRRNGHRYYYKTVRLPDGRWTKRYLGRGVLASLEEEVSLRRRQARQEVQDLQRDVVEAEALTDAHRRNADRLIAEEMALLGYTNTRSRGWRRSAGNETR